MKKLTQKEERFVLKFHETSNASEAYRHAYSTATMNPDNIRRKAYIVLNRDHVQKRLKELQDKAEQKHNWNVDKLMRGYEDVIARGLGDKASARMVTEGMGDGVTRTIEAELKDTDLKVVKGALDSIGKIIGAFEKDNEQKNDANSLAEFIKRIAK